MLSKAYGISLPPSRDVHLANDERYEELVEVMHLSLAHGDPPTEEDRDEAAASETGRNPTTSPPLVNLSLHGGGRTRDAHDETYEDVVFKLKNVPSKQAGEMFMASLGWSCGHRLERWVKRCCFKTATM
jgi:hypothetical protein